MTELGALILFTDKLEDSVAFYRTLGLPLKTEDHEGGPKHFACELGPTHFAIFEGDPGETPAFRSAGSAMPGFAVESIEEAHKAIEKLGAAIIQQPTEYPWGPRMLAEDPDGRSVEIFERR